MIYTTDNVLIRHASARLLLRICSLSLWYLHVLQCKIYHRVNDRWSCSRLLQYHFTCHATLNNGPLRVSKQHKIGQEIHGFQSASDRSISESLFNLLCFALGSTPVKVSGGVLDGCGGGGLAGGRGGGLSGGGGGSKSEGRGGMGADAWDPLTILSQSACLSALKLLLTAEEGVWYAGPGTPSPL